MEMFNFYFDAYRVGEEGEIIAPYTKEEIMGLINIDPNMAEARTSQLRKCVEAGSGTYPFGDEYILLENVFFAEIDKQEPKTSVMSIKEGKEEDLEELWYNNCNSWEGRTILVYANRWACLMEDRIIGNEKKAQEIVNECAERLSHEADTFGIEGNMFGVAVSVLLTYWKYGTEIAEWHKKAYAWMYN